MVEMDGGYFRLHNKLIHQIDTEMRNHPKDYQQDANDFLRSYYNLNKTRKVEPLRHHGKLARLQHDHQQKNKDHLAQFKNNNNGSSSMNSKLPMLPPMNYVTYEEALQSTNDSLRQLRQSKRKSDQSSINNLLNNTNMQLSIKALQSQPTNQLTKTKIRKEYTINNNNNTNINPNSNTTTQRREIPLLNQIKSKHKWSKEENQKLNELYLENKRINLPHDLEIWNGYLKNIALQFQAYYPSRKLEEVIKKLQHMIQMKQMKEEGESEYWNQIKTSSTAAATTIISPSSSSQLAVHHKSIPRNKKK